MFNDTEKTPDRDHLIAALEKDLALVDRKMISGDLLGRIGESAMYLVESHGADPAAAPALLKLFSMLTESNVPADRGACGAEGALALMILAGMEEVSPALEQGLAEQLPKTLQALAKVDRAQAREMAEVIAAAAAPDRPLALAAKEALRALNNGKPRPLPPPLRFKP